MAPRNLSLIMLALAVPALATAAPADAAVVVSASTVPSGRAITVTGDDRDNQLRFVVVETGSGEDLQIIEALEDEPTISVAPGTQNCTLTSPGFVSCTMSTADPNFPLLVEIRADMGAGDDNAEGNLEFGGSMLETFSGGPGNDHLRLDDARGSRADGGPGDDVIAGEAFGIYELLGGEGNDVLTGGWLDDQLDGGPGADRLVGLPGNDAIVALDGEPDRIDCGLGAADNARADQHDVVSGCETAAVLVTPDADGDGVAPPDDCDDADPAIRPGQNETPGNGKDDDCAGGDAARLVQASLVSGFKIGRRHTRVAALALRNFEPRIGVQLRCRGRGRGCPFRKRKIRRKITGRQVNLAGVVRGSRFRPNAVLEVWVTKPGTIGKVVRITFRRGRNPTASTLCLPAGATRPAGC